MWYTRNKFYSETAEENLQEAKIACDTESPWLGVFVLRDELFHAPTELVFITSRFLTIVAINKIVVKTLGQLHFCEMFFESAGTCTLS